MKKSNKLLIRFISITFTIIVAFIGCAILGCQNNITPTGTYIKIYDVPKSLISYDEIMNAYHLKIVMNSEFSTQEIEELFTIVKSIEEEENHQPSDYLVDRVRFSKYKDEVIVGISRYYLSHTGAQTDFLAFTHLTSGKYVLISKSSSVS
jgi:hypothetical protein